MLVLSIIDAAKNVFGTAGDKDKRKASRAANGARAAKPRAVVPSGGASEADMDGGRLKTPIVRGQNTQAEGDRDLEQLQASSQGAGRRLGCRQREGGRRDTPGWRAWEAR